MVSVFLLSSGKDDYLIPLGQLFEYILHIRAQAYLNLSVPEIEGECRLKSCWNKAFKLCSNKRLIHVKNDEPIGSLCSKLHRLQHDLVLIFPLLFVSLEFMAVAK